MNDRLSDLGLIEATLWRELADASRSREHEWRTAVLATVSVCEDGKTSADARTVIVREVDVGKRQLLIYTDARAGKVGQLTVQPDAMLVMWSKRLGWQLRSRIVCEVLEDGLAVSSHWARIKLTGAAQDYLAPLAPGEPVGTQPPRLARREHFALVTAQVIGIDWLELHPDGHRRARFDQHGGRWVQP